MSEKLYNQLNRIISRLYQATFNVTIDPGDIEIGAVELKDAVTDTRATIAAGTAITEANNAIAVKDATLGVTTGTAVETDAAGTIQQYLRGLVKNLVAAGIKLLAGENHIGEVGGKGIWASDTFNRPADTNDYAANDVVAATTSDTATTPLRGLTLARISAGTGYLTSFRVTTNNTSWTSGFRVDLYTVAQPTTALPGDNVAAAPKFANDGQFIGTFNIDTMTNPTGSDFRRGIRDDLRIPFKCASGDTKIYYQLVLLFAETNEASGQAFNIEATADTD